MKLLLVTLLSVLSLASASAQEAYTLTSPQKFVVKFSPKGGCTTAIVTEIGKARKTILVSAYTFTSIPIAQALITAEKRGVAVQIVLDAGQVKNSTYSAADYIAKERLADIFIDSKHAIFHDKVIVIDKLVTLTGSFNFSNAAEESNAENLIIIKDRFVASKYVENWQLHADHSAPYMAK